MLNFDTLGSARLAAAGVVSQQGKEGFLWAESGTPAEDPLIRMQRDLRRALAKKPSATVQWGMVIDIAGCMRLPRLQRRLRGRTDCPPGVACHRVVVEQEFGEYAHVRRRIHSPSLRPMPETALRQGLPRHGNLEEREQGVVVMNYSPLHRVPPLHGGLPLHRTLFRFRRLVHEQHTRGSRGKVVGRAATAKGYEAASVRGIRRGMAGTRPTAPPSAAPASATSAPPRPRRGDASRPRDLLRGPGRRSSATGRTGRALVFEMTGIAPRHSMEGRTGHPTGCLLPCLGRGGR